MAIGSFDETAKERMSALADGEVDGVEPAALCAAWANDPAARRDWHAWHLIGDVLRSEDLASDPHRDRAVCGAIRARLRKEPVVLAPVPGVKTERRARWAFGGAVAAGFALAIGAFALLRPGPDAPATTIAQADRAPASPVVVAGLPGPQRQEELVVADMRLIRDAQLDGYLAAHKQFAGTTALGVPSAFLRSATVDTASR